MKWFKWYYIAIPVGVWILYEMFSPKATILKPSTPASGTAATLTGLGVLTTGIANLWHTVAGSSSSPSTDATGD